MWVNKEASAESPMRKEVYLQNAVTGTLNNIVVVLK
jgi:hypothetical protein